MNQTQKPFNQILWRLVLCLALVAGMFAFVAQPAQAATDATKPVLSARLCQRNLALLGSGFEANKVYQVTVTERYSGISLKLGKVTATKKGYIDAVMKVNVVFRNPDKFQMTVCATHKVTGKKTCTLATLVK